MDIKVTQTQTCQCKRQVIGVSGVCDLCIHEGSTAFWDLVNKKITYPGFVRRLRAKGINRPKGALPPEEGSVNEDERRRGRTGDRPDPR